MAIGNAGINIGPVVGTADRLILTGAQTFGDTRAWIGYRYSLATGAAG